jgi:hypothetical protein
MSLEGPRERSGGLIKSPHDLAGGLFLIGLGAAGYIGAFKLPFGQLSGIGSGLLPKVVAVLVIFFGVLLLVQAALWEGDRLERWNVRGPLFVLGAVLVFAITIRGATLSLGSLSLSIPPLGLAAAGPLAVIVSAFGSRETRLMEIVPYAIVITLASIGLFKVLLRLPIPVFPPGYGPF